MRGQTISEIRKLRTTRTAWGLLAGLVVLVALGVLEPLTNAPESAFETARIDQTPIAAPTALIVTIFAVVIGVRSFTDEFRFGTIVPTLIATPARRVVLTAKLAVLTLVGCIFAVTAAAVALATSWLVSDGFDVSMSLSSVGAWTGRLAVVAVAWTALGAGLGLAIKHQVAAVVGSLMWVTVIDGVAGALLPDIGQFLPSVAARAIASKGLAQLEPIPAAFVLVAWTVATVGLGAALMRRRDIVQE